MIGKELIYSNKLSKFEKLYIQLFGVPINGLRIRARRVLPVITENYKNIMDAGCGPGVFTFEIAKRLQNSQVTGIDIDEDLLQTNKEIAKRLNIKNIDFEYQDINKMDIKSRFDLILTVDNLEHMEDDQKAIHTFYNALKPSGEIIIHVPGYMRRWIFFKWKVNFDVEGHYRPGYTLEEISTKVKNAGFEIIEAYYTYGWIETVTNNISYLITRARMKNKVLYAFVFPVLLFLSYFGKNSRPKKGAGVFVKAKKN